MDTGKVMKIQIHKNKFQRYWEMDWEDVPEFLLFETVPDGWIEVWEAEGEKPRPRQFTGTQKVRS